MCGGGLKALATLQINEGKIMSRRPLVFAIFSITILFSLAYNFYISSSPYQRCVKAAIELKAPKDFFDKCNKDNAW